MVSRRKGPLHAFRIADRRHTIFDGTGALIYGARWNSPGRRVIYAAETYAGALLEVLVHASGAIPKTQRCVEIEIPAGLRIEEIRMGDLPGWDSLSMEVSRKFGNRWYDERRSAVLMVPSVVARLERNVLIHQGHPDFRRIRASKPVPVNWDEQLWPR